jgi:hypothetical protein
MESLPSASPRQQTPYRCQSRNHGLCASISSCLRLAAEMSLALIGSGVWHRESALHLAAQFAALLPSVNPIPKGTSVDNEVAYGHH